ncbi:MAG: AHH domain-containing protein [Alistipes sp.]|nr:AHH domain-containing protein [Alistipes sp.]
MRWSVENGALVPESIAITGGRAAYADKSWVANYYIADHLGSVRAVTAGFDFNGAINGIEVMQHHGSHQKYTEVIQKEIIEWESKNTNYTPKEAKEYMESLAEKYRNKIFEYKKAKQ